MACKCAESSAEHQVDLAYRALCPVVLSAGDTIINADPDRESMAPTPEEGLSAAGSSESAQSALAEAKSVVSAGNCSSASGGIKKSSFKKAPSGKPGDNLNMTSCQRRVASHFLVYLRKPKGDPRLRGDDVYLQTILLWSEIIGFFVVVPLVLGFLLPPRLIIHVSLWGLTVYAIYRLCRSPGFSWAHLWNGEGLSRELKKLIVARFLLLVPALFGLTLYLAPERLFRFPLDRPVLWTVVMLLYPILSVVPQEIVFRAFFFERYRPLFAKQTVLIAISAFCFGFTHIMFRNPVAPALTFISGVMFAHSYAHHGSLKWVVAEHAAYGCLIFTLGLGWFFFAGAVR